MDSRLVGVLVGAVVIAGLAMAAREAPAQSTDQPSVGSPPVDTVPPASPPVNGPEAPAGPTETNSASPTDAADEAANAPSAPAAEEAAAKPPPPPPGPPPPTRTPTAVMQVLDKVTAETLQFEAPIGRPIRYKTLVMTVRVCETRGAQDPKPRPSAYLVMDTLTPGLPGHESPPPKRVFDGWMFANAPALHPLEHPIYDAWLVGCHAGTPVAAR